MSNVRATLADRALCFSDRLVEVADVADFKTC